MLECLTFHPVLLTKFETEASVLDFGTWSFNYFKNDDCFIIFVLHVHINEILVSIKKLNMLN